MSKKLPGVLMFLLVILKVLGTADACRCAASSCHCIGLRLISVPQDLPTNITILHLHDNLITTLSKSDFARYRSLETLHLSSNLISTINFTAFYYLPNLTWLALSSNRLTLLRSDMFTGMGNLRTLHLSNNEISDIQTGTFDATPQLRSLFLFRNTLTSLRSGMFTGPADLHRLELYSNNIADIQTGTFNSQPFLTYLDLHNNHIQFIPPNLLVHLKSLADLRLSGNSIAMFSFKDLSTIEGISILHLHNNRLTTLPSTAYDILSSISDVNIENNPWQCDCRIVHFRMKMTGSHDFENQIYCSEPSNFQGQKLIDISPEDLICEEPTITRFQRISNNSLVHGETLHLVCEASGIPTPDITVTLPSGLNATVESGERVTVDANGIIIVTSVTADDAGLYICVATSPIGSEFATLHVDILQITKTAITLPVLLGAIFGSVAGTLLFVAVVFTIWCRRNNNSPPESNDHAVVYNNTNGTAVITSVQTDQMLPQGFQHPQHFSESAASLPEEYETMAPLRGGTDERPPLPIPSRSADGYQSLRQTDAESADDYETPHDYLSIIET